MIAQLLCRIFGHSERRLTKKEVQKLQELAAATSGHQGLDRTLSARKRICRRCEEERFTRPRRSKVAPA